MDEEMAQRIKCLLYMYEDQSSIPSTHVKKPVWWSASIIPTLEKRNGRISRTYWIFPIRRHKELRTWGSTDVWGMVVPEEIKGPSAWNWSPIDSTLTSPSGSINMSTVRLVMLSAGTLWWSPGTHASDLPQPDLQCPLHSVNFSLSLMLPSLSSVPTVLTDSWLQQLWQESPNSRLKL